MIENAKMSWPGWDTVGLIGRGSFGEVYRIQRNVFGNVEQAALKVISIPQNAGDVEELYSDGYDEASITSTFQSHLESIVAEYSLMRRMNGSANIVNCDDIRYVQHPDGIGWDIFIKMELLTPLTKALPVQIPEETVIKVAKDMCAALELCKKHSIIHRDIKPQNIFVSPNGDYKLGDFGIAKTVEKTMGGTKIGTYKYMAPEVYNNQPYGSGADIYSLGLVLYWMLNERRLPFLPLPPEKLLAGEEEAARLRRFSGEPLPPPAHGSQKLKQIVLKACAYDPRARYASAAEMLHDLCMLSEKSPIPAIAQTGQRGASAHYPQPATPMSAAALGYRAVAPAVPTAPRSNVTVAPTPANTPVAPTPYTRQADSRQNHTVQNKKKVSPFVWLAGIAVVAALIFVLFAGILPGRNANNSSASMNSSGYNDKDDRDTASKDKNDNTTNKNEDLESKYDSAVAFMNAGRFDEAYNIFLELGSYKDSASKAAEIQVIKKKEELKAARVGSIIKFGVYEQDNNWSNGKEEIEWIVLENNGDQILVISKYALDCMPYNTSREGVTWETCTLRRWLNNEFVDTAFTASEEDMLSNEILSAGKNPDHSTNPGRATQDRVFILSLSEATKYFGSNSTRQCKPTAYAIARGVYYNSDGYSWWWLRSPGDVQEDAAYVYCGGGIHWDGGDVDTDNRAVRPALWIDIS